MNPKSRLLGSETGPPRFIDVGFRGLAEVDVARRIGEIVALDRSGEFGLPMWMSRSRIESVVRVLKEGRE